VLATLTLRPARESDEAHLRRVYASTREEELIVVAWDDGDKDAFLRQQFAAQDASYRAYPHASLNVIEVDGEPASRLYVARWPEEIRIMDIALLPPYRNHGIGTSLLRELLAESAANGTRLTVHVEKFNPARALYERLGFAEAADLGVYVLMEATPQLVAAGRGGDG
jgi:ribosomal protein S18 acetylase RimI-like enzyme